MGLDHGAGVERGRSVHGVERIHRALARAGGAGRVYAGKFAHDAVFQRRILERMGRDAKPDRIHGGGDGGDFGDVAAAAAPGARMALAVVMGALALTMALPPSAQPRR